jgi:transposase
VSDANSTAPESDLIYIDRQQNILQQVDVEALIGADHPARLLWDVTGKLDLSAFHSGIKTKRGQAGRPTFDPRLLITIWLYAYKRGIGSAREIARLCVYDQGMQWLTGLKQINHHTLSDFRVEHDAALKQLFEQVLGMLLFRRMITLEKVTQDGTKILARVRSNSFRKQAKIREHLAAVRQHIEELGDPAGETNRSKSAQRRALKEREQNLQEALEEIAQLQVEAQADKEPQVSETDPQARFMRTRSNGVAPAYNVQITTDAEHGFIVDVDATNEANDAQQLAPAMARVEQSTGQRPHTVIADGDYTNHDTVQAMASLNIDFYGSWKPASKRKDRVPREQFVFDEKKNEFLCPEGKPMKLVNIQNTGRATNHIYRAAAEDCGACAKRRDCCADPQQSAGRSVTRRFEPALITAFKAKMETETAKAIYRTRSAIAEFPNLWIKAKFGLRQFRTQGLNKARTEVRWAALTYNLLRYLHLEANAA